MPSYSRRILSLLAAFVLLASLNVWRAAPAAAVVVSGVTPIDGVGGLAPDSTTQIAANVWDLETVGNTVYAAGRFTSVYDRSTGKYEAQPFLAAYDGSSGDWLEWWRPALDGPVYTIEALADGRLLIGGEFTSVNGIANTGGLAMIDPTTGRVDPSFYANVTYTESSVVRDIFVDEAHGWAYVAGDIARIRGGAGAIVDTSFTHVARVSLANGQPDASWKPIVTGGSAWAIAVSGAGSRVHIGGGFASINNVADTEVLATVDSVTALPIAGWNHGLPVAAADQWANGGNIFDLDVYNDTTLFVAGAEKFYAKMVAATGVVEVLQSVPNDTQNIAIIDDFVYIGCHCQGNDAIRIVDAVSGLQTLGATTGMVSAAGGWAATKTPDGCIWGGGDFSQAPNAANVLVPVKAMFKLCEPGGPVAHSVPSLVPSNLGDTTPPTTPTNVTLAQQIGNSAKISWTGSTDDSGQLRYLIIRDGDVVGQSSTTEFHDLHLDQGDHQWHVVAVDHAGNASAISSTTAALAVSPPVNVAPTGTVTSSANFANTPGLELLAVDGDTDGVLANGSVFQSDNTGQQWWQVDFAGLTGVEKVSVWNRTDCCETQVRWDRLIWDDATISGTTYSEATAGRSSWMIGLRDDWSLIETDIYESLSSFRLHNNGGYIYLAELQLWSRSALPTPTFPVDTTAPPQPGWSARQELTDGTVKLYWKDDPDAFLWEIDRDGTVVATVAEPRFFDPDVPKGAHVYTTTPIDAAGNRGPSRTNLITTVNGPDPLIPIPTGLVSTYQNKSTIVLKYDDVAGQTLELTRDGVVVGTSTGGWFTDSGLVEGTTYAYSARWVAGAYASDPSVTISVTTTGLTAGSAPTGFTSTYQNKSRIVLKFDPSPGHTVEIFRDGVFVGTSSSGWFTDEALVSGTSYTYQARWQFAVGPGPFTTPVVASTTGVPPGSPPQDFVSTFQDSSRIVLHWTTEPGKTLEILRNNVVIATDSDGWYTDTAVISGTEYCFAARWQGETALTPNLSVSTTGTPTGILADCSGAGLNPLPPAPTGFTSTYQNKSRIVLKWDAVSGRNIEVERDGLVIGVDSDGWFTDTPLAAGTSYSYRIRWAFADGSFSEWTAAVSFATSP
ncbi:MAG: hypothetical protein R2706_01245 [Acidimicrobiales bacterium]